MANRQKVDFSKEGFKRRTSPLIRNKQPTGELTMSYDLNRETLDVPMPTITQTPYGAQLEYYLPLPMENSFMHGTRKVDQKFDAVFKELKNKLKEYTKLVGKELYRQLGDAEKHEIDQLLAVLQCVQKFVAGSEIWSFLAIFRIIFGQK